MARVPYIDREDLPGEQRHFYDEVANRRGGMSMPFKAILNSPAVASRMAALGAYLRFETPLPERIKRLAVLAAAREAEGDFVWTVQEPLGRAADLSDGIIDAIREKRAPRDLEGENALIVGFALELLRSNRVSDSTYNAVQGLLGDSGLIDLLVVITFYHGLAHVLSALEVGPEPGRASTLYG